jgi:hypothetical protein
VRGIQTYTDIYRHIHTQTTQHIQTYTDIYIHRLHSIYRHIQTYTYTAYTDIYRHTQPYTYTDIYRHTQSYTYTDIHRHTVSINMKCPLLLLNISQYFNVTSNLRQLLISNFINSFVSIVQAAEEFQQTLKGLGKNVKMANRENNLCVTKECLSTGKYN